MENCFSKSRIHKEITAIGDKYYIVNNSIFENQLVIKLSLIKCSPFAKFLACLIYPVVHILLVLNIRRTKSLWFLKKDSITFQSRLRELLFQAISVSGKGGLLYSLRSVERSSILQPAYTLLVVIFCSRDIRLSNPSHTSYQWQGT